MRGRNSTEIVATESPMKITFDHPIFRSRKDKSAESDVPEEWKQLLPKEGNGTNPFNDESTCTSAQSSDATCTIYYRSPDEIKELKKIILDLQINGKRYHGKLSTPPYISTNDALLGEVCGKLDATSVLLCFDWRPVLERKDFFGYAVLFLYLSFPNAFDAPAASRNKLGWDDSNGNERGVVRDKDFVRWKIENERKQGKVELIWNSWADVFALRAGDDDDDADDSNILSDPSARMECRPDNMFLSEQMCRMRIDVAKNHLSYAIVFPQPQGVHVYFFGAHEHGKSLAAGLDLKNLSKYVYSYL